MHKKIAVQKVYPTAYITKNDLIFSKIAQSDYADAYLFELETAKQFDAVELQQKMWSKQPALVEKLKQIRDRLVKPFGLQGSGQSAEELLLKGEHQEQQNDVEKTDEMMIDKDDKHLKFFVSIKIIKIPNNLAKKVVVTTTVQYHNLFGKIYFAAIRPFHGLVIKMTMKDLLRAYCS